MRCFFSNHWYTSFCCLLTVVSSLCFRAEALTRWSGVQWVPDADLIEGSSVVLSGSGYYYGDVDKGSTVVPLGFFNYGVTEWINLEAGYAGGASLGLKARILGETKSWMPSCAIGARNIFSHRETWLFDKEDDTLGNEFYAVLGKSVEAARLRLHFGVSTIPDNKDEMVSPFAAIEKYFGMGLYVSLEAWYRAELVHPSVFASWRFLGKHLEVSAGIVDITGMFVDRGDTPPSSPFFESSTSQFVRPGIWAGLRFNAGFKLGKAGGFNGLETSINSQSASLSELRDEVDSLKLLLKRSSSSIETLNKKLIQITDSAQTDDRQYKAIALDKLALLGSLYSAEPFDPEAVKHAMSALIAHREHVLPALFEIVNDPVQTTRIRTLAISALGEIGSQAAADIVIGFLGNSTVPELTIECLIALGKLKETRAVYLMQQLSNDPNDDIAFTAAEILLKLEKETGISTAPIPEAQFAPVTIEEKSMGGVDKVPATAIKPAEKKPVEKKVRDSAPMPAKDESFSKIDEPEFLEATVVPEKKLAQPIPVEPPVVPAAVSRPEVTTASKTADVQPVAPVSPVKTGGDVPKKEEKQQRSNEKAEKKSAPEKKKRIDTSSDSW